MAIINGRCYDWNSVTLGISGCENVELPKYPMMQSGMKR